MRESVALVTHSAICVYCIVELLGYMHVQDYGSACSLSSSACHHCILELIFT